MKAYGLRRRDLGRYCRCCDNTHKSSARKRARQKWKRELRKRGY